MVIPSRTVAISRYEGGEWIEFVPGQRPPDHMGHLVHAIKFDDGRVWDAQNGWRAEGDIRDRRVIDAAGWAEAAF